MTFQSFVLIRVDSEQQKYRYFKSEIIYNISGSVKLHTIILVVQFSQNMVCLINYETTIQYVQVVEGPNVLLRMLLFEIFIVSCL